MRFRIKAGRLWQLGIREIRHSRIAKVQVSDQGIVIENEKGNKCRIPAEKAVIYECGTVEMHIDDIINVLINEHPDVHLTISSEGNGLVQVYVEENDYYYWLSRPI